MYLLLGVAIIVVLLITCFIVVFWRLAARVNNDVTAEWLDGFSLGQYAPMQRLLDRADIEFLATQKGYRPQIAKQLMAEHRRIFCSYLGHLVQDFNQLIGIGKLMVVYSAQDHEQLARELLRQQLRFYFAVCAVWLQVALYPIAWTAVDAQRLIGAVGSLRDQVQSISSTRLAAFQIG